MNKSRLQGEDSSYNTHQVSKCCTVYKNTKNNRKHARKKTCAK